jgi:hypothetical protein
VIFFSLTLRLSNDNRLNAYLSFFILLQRNAHIDQYDTFFFLTWTRSGAIRSNSKRSTFWENFKWGI